MYITTNYCLFFDCYMKTQFVSKLDQIKFFNENMKYEMKLRYTKLRNNYHLDLPNCHKLRKQH